MEQFLKDNIALVAGIALPLVLIALFYVAGQTARSSVADPKYDAVFARDYYPNNQNGGYSVAVDQGKLVVRFSKSSDNPNYVPPKPQLFVFDHKTMTSKAVPIEYDHIVDGIVQDPDIDALNVHKIVSDPVSPDGYNFEYNYDGDSGLFGEIFGWDRTYGSNYVLRNGAKIVPVRSSDPVYAAQFIGWIVE